MIIQSENKILKFLKTGNEEDTTENGESTQENQTKCFYILTTSVRIKASKTAELTRPITVKTFKKFSRSYKLPDSSF